MLHFRLSCVVALSLSGIWSGQLLAVPYKPLCSGLYHA